MSLDPLSNSICDEDLKMYEEYLRRLEQRKKFAQELTFENYPKRKMEQLCLLNVFQGVKYWRSTKIICAIESNNSEEILYKMMEAGMDVARLNVTTLGYETTTEIIKRLRNADRKFWEKTKRRTSIALDIAAPISRIQNLGLLSGGDELFEGESVWLGTEEDLFQDPTVNNIITLNTKEFPMMVRYFLPRSRLFLDDGAITLIVRENYGNCARCLVEQGGKLNLNSMVNFVWSANFLYHCIEKYYKTLEFAANSDIDMVMVSFIRDAQGLDNVREIVGDDVAIIMKIENYIEPKTLESIIEKSDGILISRGLLGIDLPIEKVFILQNMIIAKSLLAVKPVFVGFQLLDSMINRPRPTRAEATDVANAVITNVDGLVLGHETSVGSYPIESIKIMVKIILEAESATCNFSFFESLHSSINLGVEEGVELDYSNSSCLSAVQASYTSMAKAIVVSTEIGKSAFITAALRPDCLVLAVTRSLSVIRRCNLYKGIYALHYSEPMRSGISLEMDAQISSLLRWAKEINLVKVNDIYVCLTGRKFGKGSTRTVRILSVPENSESSIFSQISRFSQEEEKD